MPSADRKSTRLNSSHTLISYAVFCLKKKKISQKYKYLFVSHYRSVRVCTLACVILVSSVCPVACTCILYTSCPFVFFFFFLNNPAPPKISPLPPPAPLPI